MPSTGEGRVRVIMVQNIGMFFFASLTPTLSRKGRGVSGWALANINAKKINPAHRGAGFHGFRWGKHLPRSLLPPNFLDLLDAGHDLPRRDGYDITPDQEGIFRRLLGYAHEHGQHRLMIVRPHFHLAHGAVNL